MTLAGVLCSPRETRQRYNEPRSEDGRQVAEDRNQILVDEKDRIAAGGPRTELSIRSTYQGKCQGLSR